MKLVNEATRIWKKSGLSGYELRKRGVSSYLVNDSWLTRGDKYITDTQSVGQLLALAKALEVDYQDLWRVVVEVDFQDLWKEEEGENE